MSTRVPQGGQTAPKREPFGSHFGSFHFLELSLESNAFDVLGICALAPFGWDFRANSLDVRGPGPRKPPKTWWHHALLNNSEHGFWGSFGFSSLVWLFSLFFLLFLFLLLLLLLVAACSSCCSCCSCFSVLLFLARSGLGALDLSLLAYLFHLAPLCEFAVAVCRSFWSWCSCSVRVWEILRFLG